MQKPIFTSILVSTIILCTFHLTAQVLSATPFAAGVDISWCTEMESTGKQFYDAAGQPTGHRNDGYAYSRLG